MRNFFGRRARLHAVPGLTEEGRLAIAKWIDAQGKLGTGMAEELLKVCEKHNELVEMVKRIRDAQHEINLQTRKVLQQLGERLNYLEKLLGQTQ